MKIYFIEDVDCHESSATMYVNVGFIDDPIDTPGLSHYLEHMLFMGNDKYKGPNFYRNAISSNGGLTNAFTSETFTQYYFSVNSKKFTDVLDIFANFFIKPEFNLTCIEKEVTAVDNEHTKNIAMDNWRKIELFKKFIIDDIHSKFGTGSRTTLLSDNDLQKLREKLINHYESTYIPSKMFLVISPMLST